jgi:hypothetical protein
VQVDLHAVFTSSASGLHKALPALVARWKVGSLHGDWVRSDGGIGVARSLRPVELAVLLGATGVKIEGNLITGNVPSADTKFSGGVVVTSSLGDSAIAPADNGGHGRRIPMATKPAPLVTCRHEVPAEHGPHLAPCLTWTAAGPLTGFVTGFRSRLHLYRATSAGCGDGFAA